ncbi:hypothetical protein TRFO_30715 [Tritrichomonas foetus]|uniref:Ubiquitin-like domain-containing protein n=1 Tax=Tritrichomonas foetus TaxID=1144522 RepID=A0A1J4JXI3_9EUKA|nr:hypothetical protein TRFO_30715 [Tritrichomonas foetus]|eukprot:OHT02244.1 hypothetical protein TRFO_30715 [Tritrichomonas foetus]
MNLHVKNDTINIKFIFLEDQQNIVDLKIKKNQTIESIKEFFSNRSTSLQNLNFIYQSSYIDDSVKINDLEISDNCVIYVSHRSFFPLKGRKIKNLFVSQFGLKNKIGVNKSFTNELLPSKIHVRDELLTYGYEIEDIEKFIFIYDYDIDSSLYGLFIASNLSYPSLTMSKMMIEEDPSEYLIKLYEFSFKNPKDVFEMVRILYEPSIFLWEIGIDVNKIDPKYLKDYLNFKQKTNYEKYLIRKNPTENFVQFINQNRFIKTQESYILCSNPKSCDLFTQEEKEVLDENLFQHRKMLLNEFHYIHQQFKYPVYFIKKALVETNGNITLTLDILKEQEQKIWTLTLPEFEFNFY